MEKRVLAVLPMIYAAAIVLALLTYQPAFIPVAVVGAMLLGAAYVFLSDGNSRGRPRNRNRNRDR